MKTASVRALPLLLFLTLSVPAYAQLGAIAGKVIDKDGKPIADAAVSIERDEVKYRVEVKTDRGGNYSRLGMEDGKYRVTVKQGGSTLFTDDNVVVSLGSRTDKTFDMRTPQPSAAATATISKAQRDAEQKANSETQGAFNAGLTALTAKNYDEAVKQFLLAAERKPLPAIYNRLGETYLNFGMLLAERGQDADAIDALQKSIKANPKAAAPYYELGMAYMRNSATMKEAAAQFEKYIETAPAGDPKAATAKQLADAAKASAK